MPAIATSRMRLLIIKEWFKKNQMQWEKILQLKAEDQAEQDDVSLEVTSDVIDKDGPGSIYQQSPSMQKATNIDPVGYSAGTLS